MPFWRMGFLMLTTKVFASSSFIWDGLSVWETNCQGSFILIWANRTDASYLAKWLLGLSFWAATFATFWTWLLSASSVASICFWQWNDFFTFVNISPTWNQKFQRNLCAVSTTVERCVSLCSPLLGIKAYLHHSFAKSRMFRLAFSKGVIEEVGSIAWDAGDYLRSNPEKAHRLNA